MDKEIPHLNEKQMNTFKISKRATWCVQHLIFLHFAFANNEASHGL